MGFQVSPFAKLPTPQIVDLRRGTWPGSLLSRPPACQNRFDKMKQEHVIDMLLLESGSDLLSRAVSSQVPSARRGLTSVFGMGTGGSLLPLPPEILRAARSRFRSLSALRFRASPALTTAQLKLTSERLHSISRFFLD